MKKIECLISDKNMKLIEIICEQNGYTYAEFNRRAIDAYLGKLDVIESNNLVEKIKKN